MASSCMHPKPEKNNRAPPSPARNTAVQDNTRHALHSGGGAGCVGRRKLRARQDRHPDTGERQLQLCHPVRAIRGTAPVNSVVTSTGFTVTFTVTTIPHRVVNVCATPVFRRGQPEQHRQREHVCLTAGVGTTIIILVTAAAAATAEYSIATVRRCCCCCRCCGRDTVPREDQPGATTTAHRCTLEVADTTTVAAPSTYTCTGTCTSTATCACVGTGEC